VSFALVVSLTRRVTRATLPARGRDRNGVTLRNDQSLVQSVAHEVTRFAYAVPSLPLTGRVVREANRVG